MASMRNGWTVLLIGVLFSATTCSLLYAQEDAAAADTADVAIAGEDDAAVVEPAPMPDLETYADELIGSVSLAERLQAGGGTMLFLGLLSIGGLTFTLERLVGLRRSVISPPGLADEAMSLWNEQRFDAIQSLCESRPSTLSRILSSFIRHRHCSSLELSELAGDIAGREMRAHLQKAYPIAVVATLAPLLGLLGTVIGMIESFEIVAIAGTLGDASLLAGSISKALVTTATGLIIAVPSLALYHAFKSRTTSLTQQLEEDVNEVLTTWFMADPKSAR